MPNALLTVGQKTMLFTVDGHQVYPLIYEQMLKAISCVHVLQPCILKVNQLCL